MGENLERIYLQAGIHDRTWCQDQIEDNDTEYIRVDLYKQLEAEKAELKTRIAKAIALHRKDGGDLELELILRGEDSDA